jgi:hypothetical protein
MGTLPLIPLLLSPFPNLPLYYLGYRVYSHKTARNGALATQQLLRNSSEKVRAGLREAVRELRLQGHEPAPGSWAAKLLDTAPQPTAPVTTGDQRAAVNTTISFGGSKELGELTEVGIECALTPVPVL